VLVGPARGDFPVGDPVPHAALAGARMIVSSAGSLMRQIVDDVLAGGAELHIVAEVAHRTSILPLVLQGVGLAVLPSAWLESTAQLKVALLSRSAPMTPAARGFLAAAHAYRPIDHLAQPAEQQG
jgi:DNA-binding transcriptional LysR family regulator